MPHTSSDVGGDIHIRAKTGENSISAAESICNAWTVEDIEKLSIEVAQFGLDAEIQGIKVLNIAQNLLEIAKSSLITRDIRDAVGNNESIYLHVLEEILQKKVSPAKDLLKRFQLEYKNSMVKLLEGIAY